MLSSCKVTVFDTVKLCGVIVSAFHYHITELRRQLEEVSKNRDLALLEAQTLRDNITEMRSAHAQALDKEEQKARREMNIKDRLIESLEDQLHRATSMDLKKFKRGERSQLESCLVELLAVEKLHTHSSILYRSLLLYKVFPW